MAFEIRQLPQVQGVTGDNVGVCGNCGLANRTGAVFCRNCGLTLRGYPAPPRAVPAVPQMPAPAMEPAPAAPREDTRALEEAANFETIERFTKIEFPNRCTMWKEVVLRIQLTSGVPVLTRALHKLIIKTIQGQPEAELTIIITAPGFEIEEHQKSLQVPVANDSPVVEFSMIPSDIGMKVVEVEFFQNKERVGHLLVSTKVESDVDTKDGTPLKAAEMELLQDPREGLSRKVEPPDEKGVLLHVAWNEREGILTYRMPDRHAGKKWRCEKPGLQNQIEESLQNLNDFLLEVVTADTANPLVWDSVNLNTRAFGDALYQMLIPGDLAKEINGLSDGDSLIISTNEQWVPWEILHDGVDYWGKRFILSRSPRPWDYTDLPKRAEISHTVDVLGKQSSKVVNVVGSGLPSELGKRAAGLFDDLQSKVEVETLEAQPVAKLQSTLPTSLLHCTCHGRTHPKMLQTGPDSSRLNNLLPETVNLLPLGEGALVFANACTSAGPAKFFGQLHSFGWQFYLRGARAFIGTLGPVPAPQAIRFAEVLYSTLLYHQPRLTLGEALTHTRKEMEKEHNLFWLLYCLYGDPDYKVEVN
jgi:hypothetical protein